MTAFFTFLDTFISRLSNEERGAAAVEYGLLLVGIAVVVGAAAVALGGRIGTLFDGIL